VKSKTKKKATIGPLITKEKKILLDSKDMAEELNRFFASVFTKEYITNIPEAEKETVEKRMLPKKVN
jgi:hypothetical protein